VSPYKECSIFSNDWPMCEDQLKTSAELFGDYLGPVVLIIIGSILSFLIVFVLVILLRNK
ncbi:MAG: hypothetical protein ACFE9S_06175, partial [Candidatus Hermodarchaeota archaeon]